MGIFETAIRQAVAEILKENSEQTDFGFFLNEEMMANTIEEVYKLLVTSRELKSKGDQLFSQLSS